MTDYEIHTTVRAAQLPYDGIDARDIDDLRKKFIKAGFMDRNPGVAYVVWNGNRALGGFINSRKFGYCWVPKGSGTLYAINPKNGKIKRL